MVIITHMHSGHFGPLNDVDLMRSIAFSDAATAALLHLDCGLKVKVKVNVDLYSALSWSHL